VTGVRGDVCCSPAVAGFRDGVMRLFGSRRASPDAASYTIYYASDVHGSDQCWRKFLGAGRHYKADALVMGGDLTGKAIVPITQHTDATYEATLLGEVRRARSEDELEQLVEAVRYNGMYPWIATKEEAERVSESPDAEAALFDHVLREEIERWVQLADERLGNEDREAFVMAGNDDPWEIDDPLRKGRCLTFCDDRVVRVGEHEMISLSYANPTPWDSPRELDEDALYERLKGLADQIEDPASSIFNLHVPPFDTGLDLAIQIDPQTLTRVVKAGSPVEIPVGSTAVRQIIEEYQPLISLHGHIHECRGDVMIGQTLAINPGSEYNSGRIHGTLVKIRGERVSHQFVVG
jgi:Icc-related predicted phosphoesterase